MNPNNPSSGAPNPFTYTSQPMMVAQSSADVRLEFIRKTYSLFLAGIVMALIAGTVCLRVPAVLSASIFVNHNLIVALVLLLGGSMLAQAVSRIEGLNYVALFGFTAFIGFFITPRVASAEYMFPGIVAQAGFLTLMIFGVLTAYVFITKKDFNYLRGILVVGLTGLILASLANFFFFKSAGVAYWFSWGVLFLMSGFVLYDTSQIIHRYDSKAYCSAALSLFLDFINMFLALLRILGGSRR